MYMSRYTNSTYEVNPRARAEFIAGMTPEQMAAFDAIPDAPAYTRAMDTDREAKRERKAALRERRTKTLNWIDSLIPPQCRWLFSGVGVIAAANRILAEIKKTGACRLFQGTIASAVNVCKKTVQRAMALLKRAGFNVIPGGYDAHLGKSGPTVITAPCSRLRQWISRHFRGGGQQSPSSLPIDRFFLRVVTPGSKSRDSATREPPS